MSIVGFGTFENSINLDPKSHSVMNIDLLGDSAKLPISNEENRKLEEEVMVERRKLLKCKREMESIKRNTDSLWRIMDNIRIDLNENQNLLRAKTAALESEESMCQAVKDENQKAIGMMKKLETELKDRQAGLERVQVMLEKQRKTLESLKTNKRVDKEQFQTIVDEIVDTDDVNINIQKYTITDEKAATDLSSKLSKLCDQISSKKRDVDGANIELKATEITLNRTNAELVNDQGERNRLLNQWEQSMDVLRKRDDDLEQMRRRAEEFHSQECTWRDILLEKEMEIRDQRGTEMELRRNVNQLEQRLNKMRSQLVKSDTDLQEKQAKLINVKASAQTERSALRAEEMEMDQLKGQIEWNQEKLIETSRLREEKQRQKDTGKLENESLEARRTRLNKEIQSEKGKLDAFMKNKQSLLGQIMKKKEAIAKTKRQQADMQRQEEIFKSTSQNYATKMKKLEKQLNKQKALIQSKETEIIRLEKEMEERKTNDKEDKEIPELQKRFEDRMTLLAEKEATELTWASTVKLCQAEMEKARKQLDHFTSTIGDLEKSKTVQEGEIAILEKRLKKVQNDKQESLRQWNVLKTEMKRLEDMLENKTTLVNGVEKEKETRQKALQEEEDRLKEKKNDLQTKIVQTEEERKKMGAKVNEVRCKVNSLINRYDAYIRGIPIGNESGPIGDDVLNSKSKERANLEKIHNELSVKLTKAEKEAQALQNTTRLISERNETFRQAVIPADRNSSEYQEVMHLTAQYQQINDHYRNVRKRIKEYKSKMQELEENSIEKERKMKEMDVESKRNEEEISKLKEEIEEQANKLDRWKAQNNTLQSQFERAASASRKILIQGDIDLRSTITSNSTVSKALNELSRRPDIGKFISEFCLETGLELDSLSDSGLGRALTRRSTIPTRGTAKNGSSHWKLDVETLPAITSGTSGSSAKDTNNSFSESPGRSAQ